MPADPFDKFNAARAAAANKEAQRKENIGRFVAKLQEKHAQTPPPWAKEGPGGRDFAQEDAAARLKIKALKAKADTWAAKEKADIESGAKKAPLTSTEKIMADKDLAKPKSSKNLSFEGKVSRVKADLREDAEAVARSTKDLGEKYPGATAARVDARRATAQFRRTDREAIDLGEKPWSVRASDPKERYIPTKDQAVGLRMEADLHRTNRAVSEGRIGDPSEFSDLAVPRSFKPNMPAAAESRMKANKPLKTALVREVEPGRNRGKLAEHVRANRNAPDSLSSDAASLISDKYQSAAETGEAQAFVGKMKPGVSERTAAHTLQSREFNYPPANQSKDLGRAVTNTIRREQAPGLLGSFTEPPGGSLMKLAKTRAAQGRSIAGPDAPAVPKNRRGMYKGKPAGVAPTVTLNSRAKGWNKIKAIEPGELPDTD